MKWRLSTSSETVLLTAFLAVSMASTPSVGQVPQSPAPANLAQRHVHRVMMPPKSARPHGRAARSTAETMAARARVPLKALPAFSVTGLDGSTVAVGSVAHLQHWLLLYRRDRCLPCDKIMTALSADRSSTFKQGAAYVIVVAARLGARNSGMLSGAKAKFPSLDGATWVEDDKGAAFAALKPRGAPTLYAMDGTKVVWTLPGGLGDPAKVERIATAWMASASSSTDAPTSTAKAAPATPPPPSATRPAATQK